MKNYLQNLYVKAVELNHANILDLVEKSVNAKFLDLGCNDGTLTTQLAGKIGTADTYGVEISDEEIKLAEQKGIRVKKFDLNDRFDFPDESFDVIHANQVIEHLYNSDNFLAEIFRTLKPGGYAIVSTENASSWCNIFASLLGWQMFSLTSFSHKKLGIGNPLALHRNKDGFYDAHVRIYNYYGLKGYFEVFRFKIEKVKGAGYFPLPAGIGNVDRIHCHFMTFKVRKM